jgi:type IV secretion system protein VirD4
MRILKFFSLILFTLIAGQYVGGSVFFKLTAIPLSYLTPDALYKNWVLYSQNPDFRPLLQLSIFIAVLVSFFPWLIVLVRYIRLDGEKIHGSARFANDKELAKSGLFPAKGKLREHPSILLGKMPVGRFKGRFVESVGQTFLGVSAPTGSGKGVGIVIPNLLNYSDSVVNTDIKLENFYKTAGFRQSQGQEIYLFAPDGYAETESDRQNAILRSHRWNPFFYIRRENAYRIGDLLILSNSLYPLTGDAKSNVWPASAGKLFIGLSLWMLDSEDITKKTPTLPYLLSLIGVDGGLANWIKSELTQSYVSEECVREFNAFLSFPNDTQGSVMLSFNAPLAIYSDDTVAKSVSGNDFDFRDLRRKGISLFVGVQPPNKKRFQGLLNLFFEQLINENTRVIPELDKTLTHQCLMLLDEFPALGRVNQIKESIGFTRQYNLRYLLIYQDKSQLEDKDLYGKEGADNIIENLASEIIYPPKKVDSRVKEISETLGSKTVRVKGDSKNVGKGVSKSVNYSLQKRQLMMPNEVVELGHAKHRKTDIGLKTLLFRENQRSFVMDKIIYFDEPIFDERMKYSTQNIPTIPLLD